MLLIFTNILKIFTYSLKDSQLNLNALEKTTDDFSNMAHSKILEGLTNGQFKKMSSNLYGVKEEKNQLKKSLN